MESPEDKKDQEAIAFLEKLVDQNQRNLISEILSQSDVNTVQGLLNRSQKLNDFVEKHNLLNEIARLQAARLGNVLDYKQEITIGNLSEGRKRPKCNAPACNKQATGYCSLCEHAVYCGEQCQRQDAVRHANIECEAYQDTMC